MSEEAAKEYSTTSINQDVKNGDSAETVCVKVRQRPYNLRIQSFYKQNENSNVSELLQNQRAFLFSNEKKDFIKIFAVANMQEDRLGDLLYSNGLSGFVSSLYINSLLFAQIRELSKAHVQACNDLIEGVTHYFNENKQFINVILTSLWVDLKSASREAVNISQDRVYETRPKGESAPDFIKRVYKDRLTGEFTRADLRKIDPKAAAGLNNFESNIGRKLSLQEINLPTIKQTNDKLLARDPNTLSKAERQAQDRIKLSRKHDALRK